MDEFTHRAAGKAAELVRHGAARAVHVVGDWCQKIVSELDATAAHLNGDPVPAPAPPTVPSNSETPVVVVAVPVEVPAPAVVRPAAADQRAGPT